MDRTNNDVIKGYLNYFATFAFYIEDERSAKFYSIYLTIYNVLTLLLLTHSFITFMPDVDKMAVLFHHFTVMFDMTAHVIICYFCRPNIQRLVEGLNVTHDYKSQLIQKFVSKVQVERNEKANQTLKGSYIAYLFTCVTFLLASVLERFILHKIKYFLLVPMVFPLSLDQWIGYMMLLIWQFFGVVLAAGMLFCLFDFLYLFYLKIITELKILNYALSTIKERAVEMRELNEKKYNKKLDHKMGDYYEKSIKHCVIHHIQIISTFKDMRTTESWMYFIGNAVILGLLVCTGVTLLTDDLLLKIKFVIIMGITMIYVFFFFWMGQDMSDASENILLTLHNDDWIDMPKKCRIALRIIMARTMKPLVISSVDGVHITMENFMALVKAAYSYFSLLMQMKE